MSRTIRHIPDNAIQQVNEDIIELDNIKEQFPNNNRIVYSYYYYLKFSKRIARGQDGMTRGVIGGPETNEIGFNSWDDFYSPRSKKFCKFEANKKRRNYQKREVRKELKSYYNDN